MSTVMPHPTRPAPSASTPIADHGLPADCTAPRAAAEGQRGHDLGFDAPHELLRAVEGVHGDVELGRNCETTVTAGTVNYDPDPVEAAADGSALICCSRPLGGVVLDL